MSNDTLFKTWEFKGIEIKPISLGRKNNIITIIREIPTGPTMFAMGVYGFICPTPEIIRALRDLDWFIGRVTEWMEEIELDSGDYAELGKIFQEVLEHTSSNRAQPVSDPSMAPDPSTMGN